MHPTLVREPFHRDGWVCEEKYDGWPMLAFKDGDTVRLVSRNGVDHAARFQNIAASLRRLRTNRLVLDCEVCSFDENLVSQFQYLLVLPPEVRATEPVLTVTEPSPGNGLKGSFWDSGSTVGVQRGKRRHQALVERVVFASASTFSWLLGSEIPTCCGYSPRNC